MKTRLGAVVLAAALLRLALGGAANAQEAEPPGDGCVLLETKSFSEDEAREARDYANSNSGATGGTFNGNPVVYRSTVRVIRGSLGQRVMVVKVWLCPQAAAAGGNNNNPNNQNNGNGVRGGKPGGQPPRGPDEPTYDPRFYQYRDGRLVPKPNAPNSGGSGTQDDHSGCDRPVRFECGQHYLWWLEHHQHKSGGSKKIDEGIPAPRLDQPQQKPRAGKQD